MVAMRLEQWDIKNAWCVMRIDANVDSDAQRGFERLEALLPTLTYIREQEGGVIMLTHMGRPTHYDPRFSTRPLIEWFKKQGFQFDFSSALPSLNALQSCKAEGILVENIRMLAVSDADVAAWYNSVKSMVQYYINDAWGSMHRTDWSLVALPQLFAKEYRSSGFLVQHEVAVLDTILNAPGNKYLFLAGGKGEEKIKNIAALKPFFTHLLLGPLASFYADMLPAHQFQVQVPEDYVVQDEKGNLVVKAAAQTNTALSIGPKTCHSYIQALKKADWIIVNGLMGIDAVPASFEMMELLLRSIAPFSSKKLFCGGDTVSFAKKIVEQRAGNYFSTGGGSTLAYLGGSQMPALEVIS